MRPPAIYVPRSPPLLLCLRPAPLHGRISACLRTHPHRRLSIGPISPELLTIRDIEAPHIGHIRVIGLNSPHNRNAISKQLLAELSAEVQALKGHDGSKGGTRVLLLTSEIDEVFCAGADLKERRAMSIDETKDFLRKLRHTFNELAHLRIPTISAVSSVALGGGLELALCTTLRVFSSIARIGLPETRLGIIPGAGGTYRLRYLVGESTAQELILTGRQVYGRWAYRHGLCNHLVMTRDPKEEVEDVDDDDKNKAMIDYADGGKRRAMVFARALGVARRICEGAPVAVAAALNATRMDKEGAGERAAYRRCYNEGEMDRREALSAFVERRKPKYAGAPKSEKHTQMRHHSPRTPGKVEVSERLAEPAKSEEGERGEVEDGYGQALRDVEERRAELKEAEELEEKPGIEEGFLEALEDTEKTDWKNRYSE